MSRRDDPYSEVKWRLADEYPEVWSDDRSLAVFVRLLVAADGSWPSAAAIPVGVPPRVWRLLVSVGLVIPESVGHRFRIRGMDKHRTARSNAASNAARMRWGNAVGNAARTATGNAEVMPHSTAQHSTAQQTPPTPAERGQDGDDDEYAFDPPTGTPRSNGTNPRAVAAREAARRRDVASDLQMRYLRGELTADQHRQARLDAGLPA